MLAHSGQSGVNADTPWLGVLYNEV